MFGHEDVGTADVCLLSPWQTPPLSAAELSERQLRNSPYLALRNVTCDSQDGVLVLRGCLPSYFLKQMAQAVVSHVEGVKKILNQIEVVTVPAVAPRRWQ